MARSLVALLLCALAASAAASSIQIPVEDILSGSEVIARDLESELESILADVDQHRTLTAQHAPLLGANILTCTVDEFAPVVALAGEVLDIVYKIREIIKNVPADFNECSSNWLTVVVCKFNVCKGALNDVLGLKDEAQQLIKDLKGAVKNFKNCLKPAAPATEAPATEAPATEAPATEAPATEAPAFRPILLRGRKSSSLF